ncbi:MAG: hypothetical protein ABI165_04150 [Bryobacteraceae bacterium]
MPNAVFHLPLAALLLLPELVNAQSAAAISDFSTGISISVDPGGAYNIAAQNPAWSFTGNIGSPLSALSVDAGADAIGSFQRINFCYSSGGARLASIRTYAGRPVVLFSVTYLDAAPNADPFPTLATYPAGLAHLSFDGIFALYTFDVLAPDSPWVFFDSSANTFLLSPASHFNIAATSTDSTGAIAAGIDAGITALPAGFTQQTLLVVDPGINAAFNDWGSALTALQQKIPPANDADVTLARLGYWTDNGAAYYYQFQPALGYQSTLAAVQSDFTRAGVSLGYMQLDSWFYPKGAAEDWRDYTSGIYKYVADPSLFPDGLAAFQQKLALPLVTHARWIDTASPYRAQFQMSGNVSTDSTYWNLLSGYLHGSGVVAYEQDWLGSQAQANLNLIDRTAYLNNMAASCAQDGIAIQYSMPRPRHFLEASKFSNVTTIRVSEDRFDRGRWDEFVFGSRLATSVGVWPWTDVFNSSETYNLLLATLSAGPVGVGDAIGAVNAANLLQAVRPDGVIVKPDAPIVPLDSSILCLAQRTDCPMVASTYSDFGGLRANYVFAYTRGANQAIAFTPAALGAQQPVYVYNYFSGAGALLNPADTFSDTLVNGPGYYIAVPAGPSGIAFLGDAGQFASLGKKRIAQVTDSGVLEATVLFAAGETSRTLYGYAPTAPVASAQRGSATPVRFDPATQLFHLDVSPDSGGEAVIDLQLPPN